MGDQCELEGQSFKFWLHASSVWKSRSFFSVIHWRWRIDKLCCCTNNVQQCIGSVLASPLHRKSKYCNSPTCQTPVSRVQVNLLNPSP